MALTAHLEALKKKHRDMSEAIEAAQRSPATDALHLSDLKKQKMRLK